MSLAQFFSANAAVFVLFVFLLGLVVGSFLNVVVHRFPKMLERTWHQQCDEMAGKRPQHQEPYNLMAPRSRCPTCGHPISAIENIPLISFAVLKGKCAECGTPISWRYPLVEFATGVLSAVVAWHFGLTIAGAAALLLTWALIALTFIDYDHQLLPDDITLPFLWLGLIVNVKAIFVPLTAAVIGVVAAYLSLWLVFQVFKLVTGKEGMGYGDFKLFAVFGAWLGWQQLPLIILLSSFVGAIVGLTGILLFGRDRAHPIPFGPFLCAAGWIALLWGDTITRAYLQFVRLSG